MNDSLQQVHSRPCSQITGMRGFSSSRLHDLRNVGSAEPHRCSGLGAERQKLAAVHTMGA